MKVNFYPKLALSNIKNNSKTYIPYILTCIGSICMFYIMHAISISPGLEKVGGYDSLKSILRLGVIVVAIFSIIIIFYTNSFLIKRRKKEFGLFNILGMEKRHIGRVMFIETIFTSLFTIICGIVLGFVLEKLIFMILLKILDFSVPLGVAISFKSVIVTVIVFFATFFVTLLNNLRQIHLTNPVELLKGGTVGEKEPKVKWPLVVIGVAALGAGYYIALTTESPLKALKVFFAAVLLVIVGTYCLFTAGSIALLKALRKNKKFYYKTNNFTSVSGMIYRMKQNAVGLASICILSTTVLVTVSTTVAMFAGQNDIMRTRFGRNILVETTGWTKESNDAIKNDIDQVLSKHNISKDNVIDNRNLYILTIRNGNDFSYGTEVNSSVENGCGFIIIPLEDYNKTENDNETLEDNEVIVATGKANSYKESSVKFLGEEYKVKKAVNSIKTDEVNSMQILDSYYIVVKDVNKMNEIYDKIVAQYGDNRDTFGKDEHRFSYCFDINETNKDKIIELYNDLSKTISTKYGADVECAQEASQSFFSVYGGLFFLGIFLGVLFLMATVLIIYYKQVSEGYDDRIRFEIMQKVGMSSSEVKKTIHSQVVMVFFIPLVTAVIHICFAFKVIRKLLAVLNFTNTNLFIMTTILTVLIFAAIYMIVYFMTARVYYKIVNQKYEY